MGNIDGPTVVVIVGVVLVALALGVGFAGKIEVKSPLGQLAKFGCGGLGLILIGAGLLGYPREGDSGANPPTTTTSTTPNTSPPGSSSTTSPKQEVADLVVSSTDGQLGLGRDVQAEGNTISAPPPGMTLWLVVRPHDGLSVHPVGHLPVGMWQLSFQLGSEDEVGGRFEISVLRANEDANAAFDTYLQAAEGLGYPGMDLPSGVEPVVSDNVERTR